MEYLREEACSSDIVSLYPLIRVLWKQQTPYADAVIAEVPTLGTCLFLDGEIQSATEDEDIYHECLVFPVMANAFMRTRVLVVGGGEGATVREVLKWADVEAVDWVDIDAAVVGACREHLKWNQKAAYTDPRVQFHARDIRDFLYSTSKKYDVILLDLPDPDPDADPCDAAVLMNLEFWRSVKAHLAPRGSWAAHCGPVRRRGASGLAFYRRVFEELEWDMSEALAYHAVIPSFQDDWCFLMNCGSRYCSDLPAAAHAVKNQNRFLTDRAYDYVFQWAWSARIG